MSTSEPEQTMLRRYQIRPGHWGEFLTLWRQIAVLRREHGFEVLIAMADYENDAFTWVLSFSGDMEASLEQYYADPRRVALESIGDHMSGHQVDMVERQPLP